ncbi:peptide-methionine (R)-S-oxide reductase MsrB [Methanofollis fontis]|uniref:Peptide methionine sulfoxide reductase MsrB n=1 Tax=Methanofollis fontis TaxID=2052832 RepID=A0A483CSI9_9EURY|nr:peptide-methionine (R)-S-oxide reductase MsrB [Methanofollis fontis]TAJ43414.1 peptide-methionine (R)-S-oxide reductase [Methanofollis fontis]
MEEEKERIPIYRAVTGETLEVERCRLSEDEWRERLSPEAFRIARQGGTEAPFTGRYHDCHENGIYRCICCGTDLFSSDAKFDSGTGWPSFTAPVSALNLKMRIDRTFGMIRTEVLCARCDAHLGHVFDDGPPPTSRRFCINSASLRFVHGGRGREG